jgi:hypothetical protein
MCLGPFPSVRPTLSLLYPTAAHLTHSAMWPSYQPTSASPAALQTLAARLHTPRALAPTTLAASPGCSPVDLAASLHVGPHCHPFRRATQQTARKWWSSSRSRRAVATVR